MTSGKKIVTKIEAIFCRKNSPKTPTKDERLKQKGLSIHYLSTTFADEVKVYNRKINTAIIESSDDSYYPFLEESSSEEIETNYINTTKINVYNLEDLSSDENGFIRAKGENVVCPRDGKRGAAFVDCVQGEDNVGIANIMLSYTWGDTIKDIIDVLEQFVARKKLDRKRSYVWICCLCNNQHRVVDCRKNNEKVPFEEFKDTFESQVEDVDHIVALMSPWNNPSYLKRVWCVFEMHTAHKGKRDISIEMPSRERENFKLSAWLYLREALGNTKIEDAEASVEADKVNILNLVRTEGDTATLNNDVNTLYRKWSVTCLNTYVSELDEKLKEDDYGGMSVDKLMCEFCRTGKLLYQIGEYKSAMHCYKKHHKLCCEEYGSTHMLAAPSYYYLAKAHKYLKEYDQAIELNKKNIAINEDWYGPDNVIVARGYFSIGKVYIEKKEWEKALEYLEQTREILEKKYVITTFTVVVYVSIGEVHAEKGDYDTAMKFLDDAQEIDKDHYVEDINQSLRAAGIYRVIGRVHEKKIDIDTALDYYSRSLRIYEKMYGANHFVTIKVYNHISSAYKHKGDAAKALEYSQKAKQEE